MFGLLTHPIGARTPRSQAAYPKRVHNTRGNLGYPRKKVQQGKPDKVKRTPKYHPTLQKPSISDKSKKKNRVPVRNHSAETRHRAVAPQSTQWTNWYLQKKNSHTHTKGEAQIYSKTNTRERFRISRRGHFNPNASVGGGGDRRGSYLYKSEYHGQPVTLVHALLLVLSSFRITLLCRRASLYQCETIRNFSSPRFSFRFLLDSLLGCLGFFLIVSS